MDEAQVAELWPQVSHDRALRAQWLLGLGALLATAALWSSWQQVQLIQEVARGANISDAELTANDARQQMFGIAELALGLVSAVVFLMWTSAHTKRLIDTIDQVLRASWFKVLPTRSARSPLWSRCGSWPRSMHAFA